MKRRNFFNTIVTGATAISAGIPIISLTSCHRGANDKIIIALIGCGNWGRRTIISTCKNNGNIKIKTVCDVNRLQSDRAVKLVEKELGYRPVQVANMKEVFDDRDIDAVWISTPDHWHALATVWACQAGKDVYVETNTTTNIWEGRKMIEAAKKYSCIVQVGFQNRSAPYVFSAREYIKSGKLGQIVHVKCYNILDGKKWKPLPDSDIPDGLDWDGWLGHAPYRPYNSGIHDMKSRGGWVNFWDFSSGTLGDDASHIMDLARMVLGNPDHPKWVYCQGGNYVWNSEKETPEFQNIMFDFGNYAMTCESGMATNYMKKTAEEIRNSTSQFPDWKQNATRIEIYGTEGMMYLGRHGGGWQVLGKEGKVIAQEYGIFPAKWHQQNFIASIRSRKQPNGSVDQGHLSATLVHLGNIAYRVGNRQLYFDTDSEHFIDNDDANKLLKSSYRENYVIPKNV